MLVNYVWQAHRLDRTSPPPSPPMSPWGEPPGALQQGWVEISEVEVPVINYMLTSKFKVLNVRPDQSKRFWIIYSSNYLMCFKCLFSMWLSYVSLFRFSSFFIPFFSWRDLRVLLSVCPHPQKPCSSRALEGGWLPRSSWRGWSATRRL